MHSNLITFLANILRSAALPWTPAGMGNGLSPWKCCKVFCALAVTVKRSVDQLSMHYFTIFVGGGDLEGQSGSFCSCGLCFEGDD